MSVTTSSPPTSSSTTRVSEWEERPWGWWQVLDVGEGYKVKRINVRAHSRLSLQTHVHRAEHWVVVSGVATCTVGERDLVIREGGRIEVPSGTAHRIANEREEELVIIEVQLGKYTGEDDIVRLADDYGRSSTRRVDLSAVPRPAVCDVAPDRGCCLRTPHTPTGGTAP